VQFSEAKRPRRVRTFSREGNGGREGQSAKGKETGAVTSKTLPFLYRFGVFFPQSSSRERALPANERKGHERKLDIQRPKSESQRAKWSGHRAYGPFRPERPTLFRPFDAADDWMDTGYRQSTRTCEPDLNPFLPGKAQDGSEAATPCAGEPRPPTTQAPLTGIRVSADQPAPPRCGVDERICSSYCLCKSRGKRTGFLTGVVQELHGGASDA
jgi:hypothetical protein